MPYIPSEEEYESGGGSRQLMGEDWYLVETIAFKVENKPDPYNEGKLRDVGMPRLRVISFEDGSALFDKDGNDVNDKLFFDFLEIEKMGLKPRPSKARKYVAYSFGQPITDSLNFESWQELVGKKVLAHAIIKKNGKQGIDDYRPYRAGGRVRPGQAAPTTPTSAPAPVQLPGESIAKADPDPETDLVAAVAKEIFDGEPEF